MISKFLILILLLSCSSKHKSKSEFKELERPIKTEQSVEAPKELLNQFEVQSEQTGTLKAPTKIETLKSQNNPAKQQNKTSPTSLFGKSALSVTSPLVAVDQLPRNIWSSYNSNHTPNEKLYFQVTFLGIKVGKILIENKGIKSISGKDVWHFHARFKSAPFYSFIYELDDSVDAYVDKKDFVSVKYSLTQRESNFDIDDIQLYDRDKLQAHWFYRQKKKKDNSIKNKKKSTDIPFHSLDPFSVFFFFQGLPLQKNDSYLIPISNKGEMMVLKAKVLGLDVISINGHKVKCIKVHSTTTDLKENKDSGEMDFWFSDDSKKNLVKAQAKIKIGSVNVELTDHD